MTLLQKSGVMLLVLVAGIALALHNPLGDYKKTRVFYSKAEFLKCFRETFPEYADIQDDLLYKKLLDKHPTFRSWIKEESEDAAIEPVSIKGLPTNYRLKPPPPAYYGIEPKVISCKAVVTWLDEPVEFIGVIVPLVLVGFVWVFIFRGKSNTSSSHR